MFVGVFGGGFVFDFFFLVSQNRGGLCRYRSYMRRGFPFSPKNLQQILLFPFFFKLSWIFLSGIKETHSPPIAVQAFHPSLPPFLPRKKET